MQAGLAGADTGGKLSTGEPCIPAGPERTELSLPQKAISELFGGKSCNKESSFLDQFSRVRSLSHRAIS